MRRALCIAVFQQVHSSLDPVRQCEHDLNVVTDLLASPRFDFSITRAANPKREEMDALVWETLGDLGDDDHVVIYFSGHGRRNNRRKLQLCTTETDVDRLLVSSYPFASLVDLARESRVGSTLIILDCCFSGAAENTLILKGAGDVFDADDVEISDAKGLAVLCASGSVEPALALANSPGSAFTTAFVDACRTLATSHTGAISVASVYEKVKRAAIGTRPRLIGENPTFPLASGFRTTRARLTSSDSGIEFEPIGETGARLIGLFLGNSYRAWLVCLGRSAPPSAAEMVTPNVYALPNPDEVFRDRLADAMAAIKVEREMLERLAAHLGAEILLLYPITVPIYTIERFRGSDQRYILRIRTALQPSSYPVLVDERISLVWCADGSFVVQRAPQDYLAEAFGATGTRRMWNKLNAILFREDSFARNAKYVLVQLLTNAVLDWASVGRTLELQQAQIGTGGPEAQLLASIVHEARREMFMPDIGTFRVDSSDQTRRKQAGYVPSCDFCMDAKRIVVSHSTRLYNVPCWKCSAHVDQTWRAFQNVQ